MTRDGAREFLRAVHPHVLQAAILRELDIRADSIVERAEYYSMVLRHADAELMTEDELLHSLQYNLLRIESILEQRRRLMIAREDVAELLASDVPEVRLLAVRLAGRPA